MRKEISKRGNAIHAFSHIFVSHMFVRLILYPRDWGEETGFKRVKKTRRRREQEEEEEGRVKTKL